MSKIGRNDPCPCGSGHKFKKCCAGTDQQTLQRQASAAAAKPPSLHSEVEALQTRAASGEPFFKTLGVFILFATSAGNAWLLEVSAMDALQVAAMGEPLPVEIEENPQTLEINWSHSFQIKDKKLWLGSYADQQQSQLTDCPVQQIQAAVKKIRKRLSPELLQSIHLQ